MIKHIIGFMLLVVTAVASATDVAETDLRQISQQLVGAKLKALPAVVKQLEAGGESALPLLEAMLKGRLYIRKSDKLIVIAERQDDGDYALVDALSAESLEASPKKRLKKVKVNNRLRVQLREIIARVTLSSEDPKIRESAVRNMLNKMSDRNLALLTKAKDIETDKKVLAVIDLALAINDVNNTNSQALRLAALEVMDGSLEPIVFNTLSSLLARDDAGNNIEADAAVHAKAQKIYDRIQQKIDFYELLEQVFFGLSLGSVLLLIATGLAITFGVMGVINMAHGELIMIGAYTAYVVQLLMPNSLEYSILVAIPVAFLVAGAVGVIIERCVIRFLQGRPLETLLATFGISLILQQTVRSIFSPLNRQVSSPSWLSGSLELNPIFSLTYNRLYILLFALLVFFILQLVLKRTSLGLHVRAVSQNRDMAKAIGIRTEWVDAMTFGLGSGIAGIAGVALSQLTNVGPNLGQAYIIDSFMVVVFGGVGNLWGTLVGGFSLGVANKFLEPVTGAVLANIVVLVSIILFIQKRPRGLFPQKGRAAG
ncbi:MAG: urea ABC transporter permease subunit UrtB [Porticoccaceae bacterium]|nr:urea ABC transporter permease subunit UrtB [Porticoccaceae bacterium]